MSAPVFDAGTLSALTQRIHNGLKGGADSCKAGAKERRSDNKAGKLAAAELPQAAGVKGKKRTRDGEEKPRDLEQQAVPWKAQAKSKPFTSRMRKPVSRKDQARLSKHKMGVRSTDAELRKAIAELGGTDEDLKLVEGAASDSELEGEDGKDKELKNELQVMIKELGFAQTRHDEGDTSTDEDASDAEAEEEQSQGDGEDEDDAAQEFPLIARNKQTLEAPLTKARPDPNGLIIEPQSQWHLIQLQETRAAGEEEGVAASPLSPEALTELYDYAKQLLQDDNERYAASIGRSSSANQFYSTIMSSGTLSDKISALTLSTQESPIHNMRNLESLINLAKKRNRGQAVETLGALKDLFGPGDLLPSDRRLRAFAAQPILRFVNSKDMQAWQPSKPLPKVLTKAHLVVWAFEDWLKKFYFEVLKVLETWCNDEISYARGKSVAYVFELLRDKPEQEANLLRLLVNKLGDTNKQIASKTSYHIMQIETAHPAMKSTIISTIESDLIFRPHQSNHAKYYGIITLNQTVLSGKEEAVARQLLNIYFALFMILLKPKSEKVAPKQKVIAKLNSKGESQGGGAIPGKKAQKKAAAEARSTLTEEELREKMLSGVLTGVNRAMPFVDKSSGFFDKHLDTLFRITHSANFNTSVQALMLIQQLCVTHQAASNRFYRTLYESLLDPRILTSSKQALYLNLLYRALKSDLNMKRVQAFVKRLMQITSMHHPSFACAIIYLVHELEITFPTLASLIDQPEAGESDHEEAFYDVPEDAEKASKLPNGNQLHVKQRYDGRKRDPEHSSADLSCLWEISPLLQHFHPSVSLFAARLLAHEAMPSKPDLSANTLIKFLDRFVYRNPKKTATGLKGHSLMQPMVGSGDTSGMLVSAKDRKMAIQLAVNSEGFRQKAGKDIGADEVFFHRYFNEIGKKTDKAKKKREEKKKRTNEDEGEVSEAEDEDEIWQALVESRPEIEGGEDDEDHLDLDDFGEEMGKDEDEDENVDSVGFEGVDEEVDEDASVFDFDDEDALLGSDDELPDALDASFGDPADPEETKGKTDRNKTAKKRRKMLKSLPMFASADDYTKMLEGDDNE